MEKKIDPEVDGYTDFNLDNASSCFGLNNTDYSPAESFIDLGVDLKGPITVTLCATTDGKFANITSNNDITVFENNGLKCVTATK